MSSSRSRYSQAAWPPDTGPHQSTAPLEVRWIPILWPLCHACARNPCHRTHTHIPPSLAHRVLPSRGPSYQTEHTPSLSVRDPRRLGRPRRARSPPSSSLQCRISTRRHTFFAHATRLLAGRPSQHWQDPIRSSLSFHFNQFAPHTRSKHPTRRHSAHRPRPLHCARLPYFEVCAPHPSLLVVAQAAHHVSLPSQASLLAPPIKTDALV